jgi:hypothetical protein
LELEARVGIERIPASTSHSKSTVYGIADVLTIRLLRFYVKDNSAGLLLTGFTPAKGVCCHFCWHFSTILVLNPHDSGDFDAGTPTRLHGH